MIWRQLSSKSSMLLYLTMLKTRTQPSIQMKILGLIKKWGEKFQSYKATVPNFSEVYQNLLRSGVVFPTDFTSTYDQYLPKIQPQSNNNYSNDFTSNDYENDFNSNTQSNEGGFDYAENIKYSLVPSKFEPKYTKLVNYLVTIVESIQLANEMIDNTRPGNVDDSLKEVMESLRIGNNRLIETISSDRLRNEKLMDLTIAIDEDINRTMNRYEFLRNRAKPEPFLSSFVEKNAMNDVPMKQKSKKNNNPPSNNKQSNPQPKLNVQPDPNVKSVDDIFDIFSNAKPVNNNVGGDHPLDLFDVSQPVVGMNVNPNMNIMPQPQMQQQQPPQKIDPTTELQNKLKMVYDNPQNNNNIQQGMYPNLSGIGPNVMMNNPIGMPMDQPNQVGMAMNQPNSMGMPINQPNPMGMPMDQPNPIGIQPMGMPISQPNPMGMPMNQPNPMTVNQPNPMTVNQFNPMTVNQPNSTIGIRMQPDDMKMGIGFGMNQPINQNKSINMPSPVNSQQGSVLGYPSMSGIDGMNSNSNMQPPQMNNPSDQAKLNAIDSLF